MSTIRDARDSGACQQFHGLLPWRRNLTFSAKKTPFSTCMPMLHAAVDAAKLGKRVS